VGEPQDKLVRINYFNGFHSKGKVKNNANDIKNGGKWEGEWMGRMGEG
jgi:hypothetical protein